MAREPATAGFYFRSDRRRRFTIAEDNGSTAAMAINRNCATSIISTTDLRNPAELIRRAERVAFARLTWRWFVASQG
jgi:hypothetical protein